MRPTTLPGCLLAISVFAGACSHNCKTARDCDANQRCVSSSCKGSNESPGQLGDSCAATSECGMSGPVTTTVGHDSGASRIALVRRIAARTTLPRARSWSARCISPQ